MRPYSPHSPSRKQEAFLRLDVEEAGYGGAAGGGKTDALIMGALQYVDVPTYSAVLLRLTEDALYKPGAIGDRCRAWLTGTAARWNEASKSWRFPSYDSNPGATIHMGYGRNKKELEARFQGPEFQYLGVEELGSWFEDAYTWMFSRLRRLVAVPHVKTRARATFNPGGVGADWIRARFIEHGRHVSTGISVRVYNALRKQRSELPWPPYFRSPPSVEALELAKQFGTKAQGAYFVPAFSEDNPALDVADYRMKLSRLDPVARAQLDEGDWWAIISGDFFKEEWFTAERFVDEVPKGIRFIRYWDLAGTKPRPGRDPDFTAGAKVGVERLKDGRHKVFIADMVSFREDPGGTEARVKATAEIDGKRVPVYVEEEPGSAGKNNTNNYASRVLFGYQVHGHRKTGPKPEFWKALSSVSRNGMLFLVRGDWNTRFIKQLCGLPAGHDDEADAASGGLAMLVSPEVSMLDALRSGTR